MNREQLDRALHELKKGKGDIRPDDVVTFSEPLASALNQAIRLGRFSFSVFAELLKADSGQAQQIMNILVQRHLFYLSAFTSSNDTFYETRLSASTQPLQRLRPKFSKDGDQ
jgi:hypothetical protein